MSASIQAQPDCISALVQANPLYTSTSVQANPPPSPPHTSCTTQTVDPPIFVSADAQTDSLHDPDAMEITEDADEHLHKVSPLFHRLFNPFSVSKGPKSLTNGARLSPKFTPKFAHLFSDKCSTINRRTRSSLVICFANAFAKLLYRL